jgi:glutaminyl-peptide cyclotransferase
VLLVIFLAALQAKAAPIYSYKVEHVYPHDRAAYTQGLLYLDGFLYEGTGNYGVSDIRKVKLETGEVIQRHAIEQRHFGEGLAAYGPSLIELTWKSGIGFVYDRLTFKQQRTFSFPGEGWGLTSDGKQLIMSDGSNQLRFLDPRTFAESRPRVAVTDDHGAPVYGLNELEYIKGEVWANVYQTDRIARINPATGKVTAWVDLRGLLSVVESVGVDVLNGIAWDAGKDRVFVTGKWWPKLFEIKLVPKK